MNVLIRIFIVLALFTDKAYAVVNFDICDNYYAECQFIYKLKSNLEDIVDNSKNKEEAYKELASLISSIIDTHYISRFVMGIHWNSLSSEQKKIFQHEYGRYLINIYVKYLYRYAEYDLDILSIKKIKDNVYSINIKLMHDDNEFVNLEFKFLQMGELFYIQDLKVNSTISIMIHQRSRISDMISEKGLNYTISELTQENLKIKY